MASIKYYDQGILLKSVDGGDTWTDSQSIVDGEGVCLAVDPGDSQKLYLGSWYDGMYRSEDGGATWQPINNGFPTTSAIFRSVTVDPTNAQRILAGVGGRVYESNDGGDNWHQLGNELTTANEVGRLAVDPSNADNVYAAVWGEGVYKLAAATYDHHLFLPLVQRD